MRRRQVLTAGAFALAASAAGCTNSPSPPDEPFDRSDDSWPSAGYDPAGTGHPPAGPDESSREWLWPRGSPQELQYGILSTPIVANGRVYVVTLSDRRFDRSEYSNYLVALDSNSGKQVWAVEFAAGLTGVPAVVGSTVIVGGRDERLYGVVEGEIVWSVTLPGRVNTPIAYGDRVYVLDGTATLAAVSKDGNQLWTTAPSDFVSTVFGRDTQIATGVPAADSGGVYATVASPDERGHSATLRAYTHDGSLRWQYGLTDIEGDQPHGPVVTDDTIYATVGGTVHAVDATTGNRQFRFVTGFETTGPPTTDGVRVYVAAKNLYALDATDGTERWRVVNESYREQHDTFDGVPYLARPPVADGTVYLRTGAFDVTDGHRVWGTDADGWLQGRDYYLEPFQRRPMAKPVVTADALYVSHTHHGVVKFA